MIFAVMQIIGGLILSLGWIPQIVQIIRTKSVEDLNLKSYLLILLGISLMEAYALNLAFSGVGYAFLMTNTLSLFVVLWMVVLILRYNKRFTEPGTRNDHSGQGKQ
ncbi:PQ-loop domain-containing transporter [Lihuaxuella thermophila]|uniref:MtN3 and saliva related transmembrane protein n=1 Tax=Lihuaxuella thermophila TaxID=1173111 RepID=A0A1H8AJY1_9BACL|nr:PQ-loop domain-containing transporter [Lihuaxuella thermophila]SEM71030.1 MtN3 and saliva related transmembrane protein [Lihuaxuella thermophila]